MYKCLHFEKYSFFKYNTNNIRINFLVINYFEKKCIRNYVPALIMNYIKDRHI